MVHEPEFSSHSGQPPQLPDGIEQELVFCVHVFVQVLCAIGLQVKALQAGTPQLWRNGVHLQVPAVAFPTQFFV
jgi:hypothetical protein